MAIQSQHILVALLERYKAEKKEKEINLKIYIQNPQSIPEHVNFTEFVDTIISEIAEIQDKIEITREILNYESPDV